MNLTMLNPQQRLAAETLEGPVLILAGAGSGKTRALTYRAANLIDHGVKPWHILCLTFTNKAAGEMKRRIASLVGEEAEDAWISTFHSSCARILRRDIEKIGYSRSFAIYDDDDTASVLRGILRQLKIDEKYLSIKEMKGRISAAKNKLLTADEWFAQSERDYRSQIIHDVFCQYEQRMKTLNALDFDDLLMKTLELFADHPPVLESYRDRFQYVMVDEYQDTNYAQYSLVNLLTSQSRNLCVVGDDDQSIYSWRGADIRNILDFEKDYPDATVIKLEQNYRSTANILDAANQVIAHNEERKDKSLWTEKAAGEPISVFCAEDERAEAGWIASKIRHLNLGGAALGEMAVLYRGNAQSRVIEETLMRSGIPYRVFGGMKFYERREVRDVIAYMRVIANPSDDISLTRIINVPKRAIGDSTMQELTRHAQEQQMPLFSALTDLPDTLSVRPRKCVTDFFALMSELMLAQTTQPLDQWIDTLIEKTGLRKQYETEDTDEARNRIENIDELVGAVHEFVQKNPEATLGDYLENIALVTDLDSREENGGYVTLMTMHSAKGLEFPYVFMSGMEEGVFPSGRSSNSPERLEEERRLCYVAITRAMKKLFMSHARRRTIYNTPNYNAPSRFLEEIPGRLTKDESIAQLDEMERGRTRGAARASRPATDRPAAVMRPGDPLSIPGVQKGFVRSESRGLNVKTPMPTLREGDRVMHRKFGEGIVLSTRGTGNDTMARIRFIAYGDKELALSLAPLVKLEE